MDHDRLFKELLTTFFVEFLELFFPEVLEYLDVETIEFLDKELFTDITQGGRHEVDLIVKAQFLGEPSFFVVHVENQAQRQSEFPRRMFSYFSRLHETHGLPVYPVALFSYDEPRWEEPDTYEVKFSDLKVLTFRFRVVQLNRLDWHRFADRANPVAAALMAKMQMEPTERPVVKLVCLNLLAKLQLDPARRALISGFVDSYLRLTIDEERVFEKELQKVEPVQQERVMEIVTSWMQQGIEQGIEQGIGQGIEIGREEGKQKEALSLICRMLHKQLGTLEPELETRIAELPLDQLEGLAEALLDFVSLSDLKKWLDD